MKSLIVGLFILAFTGIGHAQSKVMAEHVVGSEKTVKGAPFSAEALTESVQTFADGNKVIRSSTSRIYRDNLGRFRRDDMPKQIGLPGATVEVPESILIIDPVSGAKYVLNTRHATARRFDLKSALVLEKKMELKLEMKTKQDQEKKAAREIQQKVRQAEQKLRQAEQKMRRAEQAVREGRFDKVQSETEAEKKPEIANKPETGVKAVDAKPAAIDARPAPEKKAVNTTKTESLGVRNIEGVNAEGTRTTTTIPAGAIGNLRAIEVVYEKWYSPELQLIVSATHTDPAFGEQTYKLTNIQRTDPPIAFFSPPSNYRIIGDPASAWKFRNPGDSAFVQKKGDKPSKPSADGKNGPPKLPHLPPDPKKP